MVHGLMLFNNLQPEIEERFKTDLVKEIPSPHLSPSQCQSARFVRINWFLSSTPIANTRAAQMADVIPILPPDTAGGGDLSLMV